MRVDTDEPEIIERVAALDVAKAEVVCCARVPGPGRQRMQEVRTVSTMTAALLGLGVEQVAVKRGAAGATLHTREGGLDADAVAVTAVDTVGAGDAFCAGLLSAALDGAALPEALDRAVLLGAWAASTTGDWAGLPTRSELDGLLSVRPGETQR